MTIPKRWHLGEIELSDGTWLRLISGTPVAVGSLPSVELSQVGRALDFCLTSFADPIASANLADAIARIAGDDVQRIPVRIVGHEGFEALNAVCRVKCVDEVSSEFIKWTEEDLRPDRIGRYRMVTKLRLDPSKIPKSRHFFRVDGWPIALIVVSEVVRDPMLQAGCVGARFEDVA